MNHLRKVIEQISEGNALTVEGFGGEPTKAALEFFAMSANEAVCFDMGVQQHVAGAPFRVIGNLVRLPYPTCWFEIKAIDDHGELQFGSLVVDANALGLGEESLRFLGITFHRFKHGWAVFGNWRLYVDANNAESIRISQVSADQHVIERTAQDVASFLCALNCSNVRRREHKPDFALNKARAKRGKAPLFSYWTLELSLERNDDRLGLGGTHASPRLHLRRGHARQYAPNRWTWVQPHVVGNKKRHSGSTCGSC